MVFSFVYPEGRQYSCRLASGITPSTGDTTLIVACAHRSVRYLRRPGDSEFRAFKFDVLRIEDGAIKEITTFHADPFPVFGLPPTL